jgi:glutamate synthase domain-containing protein 2
MIAVLLGAEIGFAIAPSSMGCIMMRKCHTNIPPQGHQVRQDPICAPFAGESDQCRELYVHDWWRRCKRSWSARKFRTS